jgi:hypothetical protein
MTYVGRALDQNFVFASLDTTEKKVLCSAMEKLMVKRGENLITQGMKCLFVFLWFTLCPSYFVFCKYTALHVFPTALT